MLFETQHCALTGVSALPSYRNGARCLFSVYLVYTWEGRPVYRAGGCCFSQTARETESKCRAPFLIYKHIGSHRVEMKGVWEEKPNATLKAPARGSIQFLHFVYRVSRCFIHRHHRSSRVRLFLFSVISLLLRVALQSALDVSFSRRGHINRDFLKGT